MPEKRQEVTTEGGLMCKITSFSARIYFRIARAKHPISLFIEPDNTQLDIAKKLNADIVELHTGSYANGKPGELERIINAAKHAEN